MPVVLRKHGRLRRATDVPLAREAVEAVLREMLNPWQRNELDERGEVTLAYTLPGVGRVRTSVFREAAGHAAVMRLLAQRPPSLASLSLPSVVAKLTNFASGLVLVTGPASCGKTSTLAALVNILNDERREHVICIASPIEYVHTSNRAVIQQRQVGQHVASYAQAIACALREDADVLCIGDLHDAETIAMGLTAAESGQLVLATAQGWTAARSIASLVAVHPAAEQAQARAVLARSLRAVLCQRLLPHATEPRMVPITETIYLDDELAEHLRQGRYETLPTEAQTGDGSYRSVDAAIGALLTDGAITRAAAQRHAVDPTRFREGPTDGSP